MVHDSRHLPSRNPLSEVLHRNWWKSYQLLLINQQTSPDRFTRMQTHHLFQWFFITSSIKNRGHQQGYGICFHTFLYKIVCCLCWCHCVGPLKNQPFLLFWIPKALSFRYAPSTNFWHHVTLDWKNLRSFSQINKWSDDLKIH